MARRDRSKCLQAAAHRLLASLVTALFVASVAHHFAGLLAPLKQAGLSAVSGVGAVLALRESARFHSRGQLVVAKIDSHAFKTHYYSTSPLPRCPLKEDLEALVKLPQLTTIAVDLDLSPTGSCAPERRMDLDCGCQADIDRMLAAQPRRFVLIMPLSAPAVEARTEDDANGICDWANRLRKEGVQFGHPLLDRSHGLVEEFEPQTQVGHRAFGALVAAHMKGGLPDQSVDVCEHRAQPGESPKRPILAAALFRAYEDAKGHAPADLRDIHPASFSQVKAVMFGAGYDKDDQFTTAIGILNGVDVHAAIALEPEASHRHGIELLIDVVTGALLLGPLCHRLWHHYFHASTSPVPRTRHLAWLWLPAMAASIGVALALLLTLAVYLQATKGWVINPAAMALGMAAEAAVFSGIHVAREMMKGHEASWCDRGPWYGELSWWHVPWCLAYGIVVGKAVTDVMHWPFFF